MTKTTHMTTSKKINRLVTKMTKEIARLPVDQQREEIAKLRNLKYLVKPAIKKTRSHRHFKSSRREKAETPVFPDVKNSQEDEYLDRFNIIFVNDDFPVNETPFTETVCFVEGEWQIFRQWYKRDCDLGGYYW